nr:hypothetical protein [Streptomyces boncukensis]
MLSVAQVVTGDGRWQMGGVEYSTDACAQGGRVEGSCPVPADGGGTSHDKPLAESLDWVTGGAPFTVYHRAECNAVAFTDPQERALARLRVVEHREVEKAFSLQLGAADARQPLGTAAVPLLVALGALEHNAALYYGGQPTLHAPRWTQPHWTAARLVSQQGPELRTELESRVAFGGGYYDDPSAPADPAPAEGEFWLYATGTVTARRSQPFVHEAFDPPTNTRVAIAERTYALDHDCYVAAVLVTVAPAGGGA